MKDAALLYGPWIISLAALAQFWIWWLNRGRPGANRLELFESGTVEVGFDANGPYIGLAGVMRATEREVFVLSMDLTLTSLRDKSRYTSRWMAFKPNFLLPAAGVRAWEMSHPFMVMPREPGKFNVVFHDTEAFPQVKGILQNYYHQWHEVERKVFERRSLKPLEADTQSHDDLIGEFKRRDVCINSYTELNRKCYWEQGGYTLTVKVVTEGAEADISREFAFTLGKQDAKILKTNCVNMLDEPIAALLGKPFPACESVQSDYT